MTYNTHWVYEEWYSGQLPAQDALEMLASNLASIDDKLEPLEETKKIIRGYISEMVERQGGSAELPGYGKFQIRSASVSKSYDSKALDQLIIELTMNGQVEVARAIGACKKESARTGGLVITKEKETAK